LTPTEKPTFLFSVDLEDIRTMFEGGERYAERVPAMTERYLQFLRDRSIRTTFFTVGQTARAYPAIIRAIAAEGHELACHTDTHTPLDRLNATSLGDELRRNVDALTDAGGTGIVGFRAPSFSLTPATRWAYDVLADLGFKYSSSVLPAKSPIYGWPGFSRAPTRMGTITEIPMTLMSFPRVPFGGGVYFRVLPWLLIVRALRRSVRTGTTPLGYFHPCDIDTEQERFMHPYINNSRIYNYLMYLNRGTVFRRLDRILAMGFTIKPYRDFARTLPA
jgi:polysaccharide deacetylase family protein (PEP-CTERM system associated)